MVLDFEYGINTGNRFLDLVDHDEDPDEFIAGQIHTEEKPKKSSKETKSITKKKPTTPTPTTANTATTTKSITNNVTKTNKENLTIKSTNADQRRQQQQQQQSNILSDNNNHQTRIDSGRGGRGYSRRGSSAGYDRPPYEGSNRGSGQQRSQRFHKFEGQENRNEISGFEQSNSNWDNVQGNDNQTFGNFRGRGRGGPRRGNFERGRGGGGGRGRGRGGRGYFNNRNFEEGSQEQQIQENTGMQQTIESHFDNTPTQSIKTVGQELDTDVSGQELRMEPEHVRRGGRGPYRSRVFRNNRNYADDRQNSYEREGGEGGYETFRHNRRQHDRQPRSYASGIKPIEKRDGEGAFNWGNQIENPVDDQIPTDIPDSTEQTATAATSKGWAQQVDEAEKQMTLDEYKKQLEVKKQAQQEKIPQFNRRIANEGVDPKEWQKYEQKYRKKHDDEGSDDEEIEEGSGGEENESEEEAEEEQISGKKKVITIPLRFKPIEISRGSRGGQRRGTGRYRDRPYRDDRRRSKSPSQQQLSSSQQAGEYQNDEQPRLYHGGSRQGSGRGEFRRVYRNSARGGGYNRSNADPNTPDLANAVDFPTLPKQ